MGCCDECGEPATKYILASSPDTIAAERDRLREALRPFANCLNGFSPKLIETLDLSAFKVGLTVADVRRASQAIKGE